MPGAAATSGSSGCCGESRLPLEKSWPALDLKRLPAKVVQQARTLLEGSFLDRRENVLVFGAAGLGEDPFAVRD